MELDVLFFVIFHGFISTCGLFFNICLFYTALFYSPKSMRSYSILILNYSITDFLACAADLFLQPRQIPTGFSIGVISNGLCRLFKSDTICYFGYSNLLHLITHTQWSLLLSFCFRYYVLYRPAPSTRNILLLIFFIYLPSFFQLISFMWAQDDSEKVKEIINRKFPDYNLTGQIVVGHTDIRNFAALYTICHITIPITPIYITILYLRKKILNHLEESRIHMTPDTLSMHNQLLRALTIQACLPSFFWISVVAYLLSQFNIYNSPSCEYLIFTCVMFIPILSPLVSLYTIRPYRQRVYRCIHQKNAHTPKFREVNEGQISPRQQSQNAVGLSNPQFSFFDASEQEDVSFGQEIRRYQQLLTERASQVSLF
ncbi:unnamed protein product [Caenorhabditis angaria]|uniref:G-protein coupled receptors family 1 profile domain-containing protein n=1 Tax=Caenorhabditis angaria TaxID=860376 RepID=A0A9P1IVK6_9PELO|nr:unnamed protein product [Caenorhabditis angaria]